MIPAGAKKEVDLLFRHAIVEKFKHTILDSPVINFDKTPSKFVPVVSTTLAKRNTKQVYVKGSNDKRAITVTFTVTLEDQFLAMKLIYGGKTNQSLPNFKFLK